MRKYLTLIALLLVAGCGRLALPTEPTELPPRTPEIKETRPAEGFWLNDIDTTTIRVYKRKK